MGAPAPDTSKGTPGAPGARVHGPQVSCFIALSRFPVHLRCTWVNPEARLHGPRS